MSLDKWNFPELLVVIWRRSIQRNSFSRCCISKVLELPVAALSPLKSDCTLKLSSPCLGGVVRAQDWLHALGRWVYHVRARFLPCAAMVSVGSCCTPMPLGMYPAAISVAHVAPWTLPWYLWQDRQEHEMTGYIPITAPATIPNPVGIGNLEIWGHMGTATVMLW